MDKSFGFILYFASLFAFVFWKRHRVGSQNDFVIGGRKMGKWTAALAAHASDMSHWLFMAYPAKVIARGGQQLWVAIGLVLLMWVNWRIIAPKIRRQSEESGHVTVTGFLEHKLDGGWPIGRMITSLSLFLFYTVYVGVTLYGMGILIESLFPLSYQMGVFLGLLLILPYVVIGGYLTMARVDLVQGIFLLAVILFVPLYIIVDAGGATQLFEGVYLAGKSFSLFADGSIVGVMKCLFLMFGWGLGYFGQPHILTKFMGIKHLSEIRMARKIGLTWQILSLGAATSVGFLGLALYRNSLADPQHVFIQLVTHTFPPVIAGIFLCAVLAAIINTVGSMLLVLSTTITEDLYKRFFRKEASDRELLIISRLASFVSAGIGVIIALSRLGTIDQLVLYAWSGLGATFGPLMVAILYAPSVTPRGAWIGMAVGGGTVALWPLIGFSEVPPLIVAFPLALASIHFLSRKERGSIEQGI